MDEMREALERLKDLQREALVALNGALHHGNCLVQQLDSIGQEGSLDSRPGQIRLRAQLAKHQVEKWMERLHERRDWTTRRWSDRKHELEQCLALALITADLAMLHHLLEERTESLNRNTDQLGDAHASAQLLLHEHKKLMPEAKDMQEQALKIVKATEDFALDGHFAGPEAISKAYQLLHEAANYLHLIDQRESTLHRSIEFFDNAHSAIIKLDQLEVQLKTGDLGLSPTQLETLHATVAHSLEEVTAQPLQLGYALIQDIPGAEGVKRMVEQIENKKISLSIQCTAHKEENVKANRMYNNFIEKYEQVSSPIFF
ncbi:hypothetical protein AAG570_004426 [Ranatra chinensis]|uniref:Uncharacterized protein n=1 Tax=Ranatra chinensis TaxID=642074 RepID=A0ABD0Y139_9HEMI